jgi:hypothetical protein
MRRLGGKDLFAKQIRDEFIKIHFDTNNDTYRDVRLGPFNPQNTSFTYGLKRAYLSGKVTRRLQNTNSVNYRTLRKFVYSLA